MNKHKLLIITIVVLLALAACGDDRAQTHVEAGNNAQEAGDYDQAIVEYEKAIALDPELVTAYSNRGGVYLNLGEYEQAIADCDRAIELDPELTSAYYNRGGVYLNLGDYKQAIADYDRAIELDPELAMAYSNRGYAYDEIEQYEQALANYDKAIELAPELAKAYGNRAVTFAKLEQYEQAMADCDQAIALDRNLATAYLTRGLIHWELGDQDRARADLEQVVELTEDPALRQVAEMQLQSMQENESTALTLQTYEHPTGAFTIDHPEGWEILVDEGQVMFRGPSSFSMGQAMMVMFGSSEELFAGMASQPLAEIAEQIVAVSLEGSGSDYEITAKEQISESHVYLSAMATDQSFGLEFYLDQAEETTFMLMLISPPESGFYQAWDTIIASYTVHPAAIK